VLHNGVMRTAIETKLYCTLMQRDHAAGLQQV
jgi:hypothetical protein